MRHPGSKYVSNTHTAEVGSKGKWEYMDVKTGEKLIGFHGYTREYTQTQVTTVESLGLMTMSKNERKA